MYILLDAQILKNATLTIKPDYFGYCRGGHPKSKI